MLLMINQLNIKFGDAEGLVSEMPEAEQEQKGGIAELLNKIADMFRNIINKVRGFFRSIGDAS